MAERAWRKTRLDDALVRTDLRDGLRAALATGPLCDHCLGRLVAGVDTGLANAERGRRARLALAAPPPAAPALAAPPPAAPPLAAPPPAAPCSVCGGLFDDLDTWVARARQAIEGWEFDTLAVASYGDPAIEGRDAALARLVGRDLGEPYKQAFNRLLGVRLCDLLGCQTDLENPDLFIMADHVRGTVTLRVEPLFACGRYRKIARGFPQSRWRPWRTSIQQIVGDPICRAADGRDHAIHACGREDVDVRCLGERPFVVQVHRPHRRHLDWAALTREIAASGKVEVVGLARCGRPEVARLKSLRPEKTYRALVRLAGDADAAHLAALEKLVGRIEQHTPTRVLKRRSDLLRERHIRSIEWRAIDPRTIEITVRAQAGTYIKEFISGNDGRTRPSVAEALGLAAECLELDVTAIHVDDEPPGREDVKNPAR